MGNIVIDLFHGDSGGLDGCYAPSPAYSSAVADQETLENALIATLSASQKQHFQQYQEACRIVNNLASEQDFFAGYRFGVRLMISALPDEIIHI